MLDDEAEWGVSRLDTYRDFAGKVKALGEGLKKLLHDLKAQGKRIVAYGAAAKGATLLNSLISAVRAWTMSSTAAPINRASSCRETTFRSH
jgi:hypothetical protein